jgi:hypothetical protein
MLLTISFATCTINQFYPTSQSQEKFQYFKASLSPSNIVLLLNNNSCHDFTMCNYGYVGNKNSRRLICRQGHLAKRSVGAAKMSATQLPTSADEKCTSSFTLITGMLTWYVCQYNSHYWAHRGHPCLPCELQYDTIPQIPKETLEIAKELLSQLIPYSVVGQYIETEAGATLTPGSLAWLRQTVLRDKHGDGGATNGTTAQKLINVLDSTKGMAYVTYTGDHVSYDSQLGHQLSIPP